METRIKWDVNINDKRNSTKKHIIKSIVGWWGGVATVIRNGSGRTWKRAKRPGAKQQKKGKVGEEEVNEKIGETARISRCRNKTDNISPSE